MHFHKTISFINEPTEFKKSIHRTAARAIIIEGEKILMVRSELGYLRLPGGRGGRRRESHGSFN